MNSYWKHEDFVALEKAMSFAAIGKIALRVQKRMPDTIGQVCGPISTGGKGSAEENLKVFSRTIESLSAQNILYDQRPFEESLGRVVRSLKEQYDPYDLLETIYRPLFSSGKVKTVYFIHGWESSQGARWEHDIAKTLGIAIVYLEKDDTFD
jgi:hypothetical protein